MNSLRRWPRNSSRGIATRSGHSPRESPPFGARRDPPTRRDALRTFAARVASVRWTEEAIKESMVSLTKSGSLPVDTNRFFRDLYLVLLGSERGPRAAPFLAVLEKEWVLRRLKDAAQ